ncbi:MAG: hypothetical protein GX616_10045 [Planctomycetes bacterium]|nr:hypothetical protein [Planctomycetota bacterium]
MKRIFRTTITNTNTNQVTIGFSGRPTIEEAVAATLRRVEESTPIGELPNTYNITVDVLPTAPN